MGGYEGRSQSTDVMIAGSRIGLLLRLKQDAHPVRLPVPGISLGDIHHELRTVTASGSEARACFRDRVRSDVASDAGLL